MKKKFGINVDCAECAAKMEDKIRKLPGVSDISVNFLTQKLTITADDENFDDIMQKAQKCCTSVDDDCVIAM